MAGVTQSATGRDKDVRDFFARLASIDDVEALDEHEALELVKRMVELFPYLDGPALGEERRLEVVPDSEFSANGPRARLESNIRHRELLRRRLRDVHADCRAAIAAPLTGLPFELPYQEHQYILDAETETIHPAITLTPLPEHYHHSLESLVAPHRPFPFRRCPRCRAIFPRTGNQKFCTRECTVAFNEDARREKKREYMRHYNRRKRT